MTPINDIILDHEDFLKIKLLQATLRLKENSNQWLKIRGNLEPKYKFTVSLDSFSTILGEGILVLPSRPAIWQKSSSVVELFVRYTFEHEQDAAVREMLFYGLTERNRVEFNPSLVYENISYRFASSMPPNLLGIIRIKTSLLTTEQIESFINTWNGILQGIYQQKLSYDSYHSFLEKSL